MSYLTISFDSDTNNDDEVLITGSFNRWSEKLPLKRKENQWEFQLDPKEVTEPLVFKFIIKSADGAENWCCSGLYEIVTDESGNQNNVVGDLQRLQTEDTSEKTAEDGKKKTEAVGNNEQVEPGAKNETPTNLVDSDSEYENDQSNGNNDNIQSTIDNKPEEFNPFIDEDFKLQPTSSANLHSSNSSKRVPHQNISNMVHISSVNGESSGDRESSEEGENSPRAVTKVLYAFPWFFKFLFLRIFGCSNSYFSVRRFVGQLFGFIHKPSENNNN